MYAYKFAWEPFHLHFSSAYYSTRNKVKTNVWLLLSKGCVCQYCEPSTVLEGVQVEYNHHQGAEELCLGAGPFPIVMSKHSWPGVT